MAQRATMSVNKYEPLHKPLPPQKPLTLQHKPLLHNSPVVLPRAGARLKVASTIHTPGQWVWSSLRSSLPKISTPLIHRWSTVARGGSCTQVASASTSRIGSICVPSRGTRTTHAPSVASGGGKSGRRGPGGGGTRRVVAHRPPLRPDPICPDPAFCGSLPSPLNSAVLDTLHCLFPAHLCHRPPPKWASAFTTQQPLCVSFCGTQEHCLCQSNSRCQIWKPHVSPRNASLAPLPLLFTVAVQFTSHPPIPEPLALMMFYLQCSCTPGPRAPSRCVFLVCPDACPCLPYPYRRAAVATPPPPHVSNEHFRSDRFFGGGPI